MKRIISHAAVLAALCTPGIAFAQTATGNFNVRMTVAAECRLASTNDLNFGSAGIFTNNIDQSTTLSVQCTNGTPYSIGLNQGTNGTSVSDRKMKSTTGTDMVSYQLFRDASRTQNWGATAGTDTAAGTGSGSSQTITVYGRVPTQSAVATGTYTDVITVSVNY